MNGFQRAEFVGKGKGINHAMILAAEDVFPVMSAVFPVMQVKSITITVVIRTAVVNSGLAMKPGAYRVAATTLDCLINLDSMTFGFLYLWQGQFQDTVLELRARLVCVHICRQWHET